MNSVILEKMSDDRVQHLLFFNDAATTEIYTLSLHDALPISPLSITTRPPGASRRPSRDSTPSTSAVAILYGGSANIDRKSTRLNSSHANISYAVFCLKKKNMSASRDSTSSLHGYSRSRTINT